MSACVFETSGGDENQQAGGDDQGRRGPVVTEAENVTDTVARTRPQTAHATRRRGAHGDEGPLGNKTETDGQQHQGGHAQRKHRSGPADHAE